MPSFVSTWQFPPEERLDNVVALCSINWTVLNVKLHLSFPTSHKEQAKFLDLFLASLQRFSAGWEHCAVAVLAKDILIHGHIGQPQSFGNILIHITTTLAATTVA